MAGAIQYATFPGINQVISANYTLSHGITPGVAALEIIPQLETIAEGGPLIFLQDSLTLIFPDCKIDQASLRRNEQGWIWHLSVFDRRWKWAFGTVSGAYNRRQDDGTIFPDSQKTPKELATLLLDAMGERDYDLSGLTDDRYPPAEWDNDNPAQKLADLAESLGCRVVLRLNNTVQIARLGVGEDLPDLPVTSDDVSINPPERPDSLRVVCGPTRIQYEFALRAVGQDVDGAIVPINGLTYKPTAGWKNIDVPHFSGVDNTLTALGQSPRELAKQTVFRWYQIDIRYNTDGTEPLKLPLVGKVDSIRQLLPISDEQVETFIDASEAGGIGTGAGTGKVRNRPALVSGQYYSADLGFRNTPDNVYTPYTRDFSIDKERGIVQFSDYVFLMEGASPNLEVAEAIIYLRVAVNFRDKATFSLHRYNRETTYPDASYGTGPRILKHDEMWLNVVPTYNANWTMTGYQTNESLLVPEADYYIQAADLEYQTPTPQQKNYIGIIPLSPDGAIQQVTWQAGVRGAFTQASRNNEVNPAVPGFRERRFYERLKVLDVQGIQQLKYQLGTQKGWHSPGV